jgi:hypothetical protein
MTSSSWMRVLFGSARHIVNLRQPWKGGPDIAGPVARLTGPRLIRMTSD